MKRQQLTVTRNTQASVAPNGDVVLGTPTTLTILASVQPADRKQLESFRFLRDYKQLYTLYSSTELNIAQAGKTEADFVSIYGRDFEVITCESWQNGIRSHYKMIVGR